MAFRKKSTEDLTQLDMELKFDTLLCKLVGRSPLIMHRMAEKAWQELLMPAAKKNSAERAGTVKHFPIEEYRSSVYRNRETDAPTLLHMPSGAFKKAIASAAIDLPGTFKSTVGRLTGIPGTTIYIYGIPQVYTKIVRNSGINRSPDVRTRAIFAEWACTLEVEFATPIVKIPLIAKLVEAAGLLIGIGDGRSEKGASSFGSWRVASDDDADFKRIVANGGRVAQQAALDKPSFYDDETREIIEWFESEHKRRTEAPARRVSETVETKTIVAREGARLSSTRRTKQGEARNGQED